MYYKSYVLQDLMYYKNNYMYITVQKFEVNNLFLKKLIKDFFKKKFDNLTT